ncbi:MAG TPA: hypothetical protein VMU41_05495 [Candidatus Binataceae bacterium]|nr:hypothetical protein [Candidatus Binataceae bacterium]
MGRVIASRLLVDKKASGLHVTIKIGEPRQFASDDWLCPFSIEGIVESGVRFNGGVDALQSLILAIGGVRYYLEQTGRELTWLGDAGGTHLPLQVPTDYGKAFEKKIQKLIDREEKHLQLRRILIRKAEIAKVERRLKTLKKQKEPLNKARHRAEVAGREAWLTFVKKAVADWEARVRKWNP